MCPGETLWRTEMRRTSWVPLDLLIALLQVQGDYNKSGFSCACETEERLIVYLHFLMILWLRVTHISAEFAFIGVCLKRSFRSHKNLRRTRVPIRSLLNLLLGSSCSERHSGLKHYVWPYVQQISTNLLFPLPQQLPQMLAQRSLIISAGVLPLH